MFTSKTTVRVRYSETDKMGVVYHGNYAQYLEIGRTDAFLSIQPKKKHNKTKNTSKQTATSTISMRYTMVGLPIAFSSH